jgi:hypothetical protein
MARLQRTAQLGAISIACLLLHPFEAHVEAIFMGLHVLEQGMSNEAA